jgi:hypothetical protein
MEVVEVISQYIDKVQNGSKVTYDYHTKFGGYISNKNKVLNEIKQFINEFSIK